MTWRSYGALLGASSIAWLAALMTGLRVTSDKSLLAGALLLPPLLGALIARYPWSPNPPASVDLAQKSLQGLMVLVGALWLIFTSMFLGVEFFARSIGDLP